MLGCSFNLFMMLSISSSFFNLQMLGCSLNLFMMLSIWTSFFYFANVRVFLQFIYDAEYMVLLLLFCKCKGAPSIYLWCWVYGPLSFILQMLGCFLNLFMRLSTSSSFFSLQILGRTLNLFMMLSIWSYFWFFCKC